MLKKTKKKKKNKKQKKKKKKKHDEKGYFFRARHCAALSSFRIGKIQNLFKKVGFFQIVMEKSLIVHGSQN